MSQTHDQQPAHLDIEALGIKVRLIISPDALPETREAIARAWTSARSVTDTAPEATLDVPGHLDTRDLLSQLSTDVTLLALEHAKADAALFHAAGIALPDGKVVTFVGPSGRGKTTLARTLGTEFGYVSDETVGIQDDLSVATHRKPLSIIDGAGPKKQVAPSEAGLLDLPEAPLRLAKLVLLERHQEPMTPLIETLPLLEAVAGLLPETSYIYARTEPLQRIAALAQRTGGVVRLHYSAAESIAAFVPDIVAATHEVEWRAANAWHDAAPFAPGNIADAIETAEGIAVLADGRVLVLAGVGPAVWNAARNGADFDAIATAVVDKYGPPPAGDAAALVREVLDQLIDQGLLQERDPNDVSTLA